MVGVGVFEVAVTARMASRWLTNETPPSSDTAPGRAGDPTPDRLIPSPPPVSAPGPADSTAVQPADTDTDVAFSDIRAAFAALASEEREDEHAEAIRFIASHSPGRELYELLEELDARSASSPIEAVSLLDIRSQLRRALCAEWGDDPFGDATARLGCPGVVPERR